jgi:hypothetical protein
MKKIFFAVVLVAQSVCYANALGLIQNVSVHYSQTNKTYHWKNSCFISGNKLRMETFQLYPKHKTLFDQAVNIPGYFIFRIDHNDKTYIKLDLSNKILIPVFIDTSKNNQPGWYNLVRKKIDIVSAVHKKEENNQCRIYDVTAQFYLRHFDTSQPMEGQIAGKFTLCPLNKNSRQIIDFENEYKKDSGFILSPFERAMFHPEDVSRNWNINLINIETFLAETLNGLSSLGGFITDSKIEWHLPQANSEPVKRKLSPKTKNDFRPLNKDSDFGKEPFSSYIGRALEVSYRVQLFGKEVSIDKSLFEPPKNYQREKLK